MFFFSIHLKVVRSIVLQPRTLFEVPSSVPWHELANLLNAKFKHETGRGLTEDHLYYLASKLFGKNLSVYEYISNRV